MITMDHFLPTESGHATDPVLMGVTRGLAQVRDEGGAGGRARLLHPHGAHRHIGRRPHRDVVAELRAMVLQRFGVVGQAGGMGGVGEGGVMRGRVQVGDRRAPIPQESLGSAVVAHDHARERRQPRGRVVAAETSESRR